MNCKQHGSKWYKSIRNKVTDFIFELIPTGLIDFHVSAEILLDATTFFKVM